MRVRVAGRGEVSIEELETMITDYLNGQGPEPDIEGTATERAALMHYLERTADAQRLAVFSGFIARQQKNNTDPS